MTIEKFNHEVPIKDLTEMMSIFVSQKTIANWNFKEEGMKIFPQHEPFLDALEYMLSNIIEEPDLDAYFKCDENKNSSIKIDVDQTFMEMISKSKDCTLKKRFQESKKIKSQYICDKNMNFVSTRINEAGTLELKATTKSQIEKSLVVERVKILYNYYYLAENAASVRFGNKSFRESKMYGYFSTFYREIRDNHRNITNGRIIMNTMIKGYSYNGDRNINELRTVALNSGYSNLKMAALINGMFNYSKEIETLIRENTEIEKEMVTNPVSGFKSVRNIRIKSSDSKKTETEVSKLIQSNIENNEFFESLSAIMKEIEIREQKDSITKVEFVSGPEVAALYNVSSYNDTAYHLDSRCDPFNGKSSGTLFTSCMRQPENRNKIDFYANNPHFIKLLVCTSREGKRLHARAISWIDTQTNTTYVDRIFYQTESDLLRMTAFINNEPNTFLVNRSAEAGILSEKRRSEFLIPFEYTNASMDMPYFDTMHSSLYIENGQKYIGKCGSESIPSDQSEMKKDVVYRTGANFYATLKLDVNKKSPFITNRCTICGEYPKKGITLGGSLFCSNHITVLDDGRFVARENNQITVFGEQPKIKERICTGVISMNSKGIVITKSTASKDITEISVTHSEGLNSGILFILRTLYGFELPAYSKSTEDIFYKSESAISTVTKSILDGNRDNEQSVYRSGGSLHRSSERVIFDTTVFKLLRVKSLGHVIVPKIVTEEDAMLITSLMKLYILMNKGSIDAKNNVILDDQILKLNKSLNISMINQRYMKIDVKEDQSKVKTRELEFNSAWKEGSSYAKGNFTISRDTDRLTSIGILNVKNEKTNESIRIPYLSAQRAGFYGTRIAIPLHKIPVSQDVQLELLGIKLDLETAA